MGKAGMGFPLQPLRGTVLPHLEPGPGKLRQTSELQNAKGCGPAVLGHRVCGAWLQQP